MELDIDGDYPSSLEVRTIPKHLEQNYLFHALANYYYLQYLSFRTIASPIVNIKAS